MTKESVFFAVRKSCDEGDSISLYEIVSEYKRNILTNVLIIGRIKLVNAGIAQLVERRIRNA